MILSMTGYGKAHTIANGISITAEIRSLNHKALDLNFRFPSDLRDAEPALRTELSKRLQRGKVDVTVSFTETKALSRKIFNKAKIRSYLKELKSIAKEFRQESDDLLEAVITLPGVISEDERIISPSMMKKVRQAVLSAADEVITGRKREGKKLEHEFTNGIHRILQLLEQVMLKDPERKEKIRQRILKNITDIQSSAPDMNRFEQEMFYYIEKLDISEEIQRLRSHCDFFMNIMKSPAGGGKKLEFITQEILREVNTIGSKAQDETIQQKVVEMKDAVEKIREQVQNVV